MRRAMAAPDSTPLSRPAPTRAKRPAAPRRGKPSQASAGWRRWWKVALLVGLVLFGIPIADALAGEVVALLGAAILFGFLLGRWTARR